MDAIRGGAATSGGCTDIGNDRYIRWDSDETDADGCTSYEGVTMCSDPCE